MILGGIGALHGHMAGGNRGEVHDYEPSAKKGTFTTHLNLSIGARFLARENAGQPKMQWYGERAKATKI